LDAKIVIRILICFFACLLWFSNAYADKKSDFLDSIQMPQKGGDLGRLAINKVLGQEIVFQKNGETVSYIFASAGHVLVTKVDKPIEGYFGDGPNEGQVCFIFGETEHFCYLIWANTERMTMTDKNGDVLEGKIGPAKAAAAEFTLDKTYCSTFKKIASAARKGSFESLVDKSKAVDHSSLATDGEYQSTISVANQRCTIDHSAVGYDLSCPLLFKTGDSRAEQAYEFLVTQFENCLGSKIIRSSVDSQIFSKYESGFSKDEAITRDSSFDLSKDALTNITLGTRLACQDVLTCKKILGVWLSTVIH
jgi:hypothetical protein